LFYLPRIRFDTRIKIRTSKSKLAIQPIITTINGINIVLRSKEKKISFPIKKNLNFFHIHWRPHRIANAKIIINDPISIHIVKIAARLLI